jgi:hypothetical protein
MTDNYIEGKVDVVAEEGEDGEGALDLVAAVVNSEVALVLENHQKSVTQRELLEMPYLTVAEEVQLYSFLLITCLQVVYLVARRVTRLMELS